MLHEYYEFEIQLRGVSPTVWRRFLLRCDLTFEDLHQAIQDACGWKDIQIYRFWSLGGSLLARKDDFAFEGWPYPMGRDVPLAPYFEKVDLARWPRNGCIYEYQHETWYCDVHAWRRVTHEERFERRFKQGARGFPPEGCPNRSFYDRCVFIGRAADLYDGPGEYSDRDGVMDFIKDWRPDRFLLQRTKLRFDR